LALFEIRDREVLREIFGIILISIGLAILVYVNYALFFVWKGAQTWDFIMVLLFDLINFVYVYYVIKKFRERET